MIDVVLSGSLLQERGKKLARVTRGAQRDCADAPVTALHHRVVTRLQQHFDRAMMPVVFGHGLLVFHRAVQRTVLMRRFRLDVGIGAMLEQQRHRVTLSGKTGIHDRLPIRRHRRLFPEHCPHGLQVPCHDSGGEFFGWFHDDPFWFRPVLTLTYTYKVRYSRSWTKSHPNRTLETVSA
jgi:hypothetical protein